MRIRTKYLIRRDEEHFDTYVEIESSEPYNVFTAVLEGDRTEQPEGVLVEDIKKAVFNRFFSAQAQELENNRVEKNIQELKETSTTLQLAILDMMNFFTESLMPVAPPIIEEEEEHEKEEDSVESATPSDVDKSDLEEDETPKGGE